MVARAKYTNGDIHEWVAKEPGVSIYQRLTMANGNIAEYGYYKKEIGNIWRLYESLNEEVQLVKMPDNINYSRDNVSIIYELVGTYRRFTNPDVMAGFIGALAEIKMKVEVSGSAYEQGSCFPSALHVNGESIDTHYFSLSTDSNKREKDKDFITALYKFHFRIFRIGIAFKKIFQEMPGYENGGTLHNDHLHTEQFEHKAIIQVS